MTDQVSSEDRKNAVHIEFLDVVARSSTQASRWVSEFRSPVNWSRPSRVFEAMRLFQVNDRTAAERLLSSVAVELNDSARDLDPAILHLTHRWLFSAYAYLKYLLDDIEGAKQDMKKARDAVASALETHDFVVPFASQVVDYTTQMARIARREGDWSEVARRIRQLRDIYLDRLPLFTLSSGQRIFHADIVRFLHDNAKDDPTRAQIKSRLDEPHGYLEGLRDLAEHVYARPDMVITFS